MSSHADCDVMAVDVGNSRVKLGWFPCSIPCANPAPAERFSVAGPRLPEPAGMFAAAHDESVGWTKQLADWMEQYGGGEAPLVAMAQVNAPAAEKFEQEIRQRGWTNIRQITVDDLPLQVCTSHRRRVGVDRLVNAVAANLIRPVGEAAIIVDVGTAVTIDLLSADGAFQGGAILPGPDLAFKALHRGTNALPLLSLDPLSGAPDPLGRTTKDAIIAGVYWGVVGGIRCLVEQQAARRDIRPTLFITGGAAGPLVESLRKVPWDARYIAHLSLAGIAAAVREAFADANRRD